MLYCIILRKTCIFSMSEPSIEGRKSRLVAIEQFLQFVEACVHLFLQHQQLYPIESFRQHKRFGRSISLCDIYAVRKYTKTFCKNIRTLILFDRVAAVWVHTPSCRLVIAVPHDFGRTFYYAIPPTESRSDLEISCLCSEVLSDCFGELERKMNQPLHSSQSGATTFPSWGLQVETKPVLNQTVDSLEVPAGFNILSSDSDQSFTYRCPLKSAMVGETVVVSVSLDTSIS